MLMYSLQNSPDSLGVKLIPTQVQLGQAAGSSTHDIFQFLCKQLAHVIFIEIQLP